MIRSRSEGLIISLAVACIPEDSMNSSSPASSSSITCQVTYTKTSASQTPSLRGVQEDSSEITFRRNFGWRHLRAFDDIMQEFSAILDLASSLMTESSYIHLHTTPLSREQVPFTFEMGIIAPLYITAARMINSRAPYSNLKISCRKRVYLY